MGKKDYMNEHQVALFTCTICFQLFDCPTTISDCNHTFCKKCIEKKFTEENVNACPVCKVDLGVAPLARLTADSRLEDMMSRYFVPKPESVKPALRLQYFRKRKASASSLLGSTSNVVSLPEPNTDAPMEAEKLGEQVKDLVLQEQSSSSVSRKRPRKNPNPQSLSMFKAKQQDSGMAVASPSGGCMENEELSRLLDRVSMFLTLFAQIEEMYSLRSGTKRNMNPSGAGTSSQGTMRELRERTKPVWFRLVAMENQRTSEPLAQIGTPDTWFKADGNARASLVIKMIVQKLSLQSEIDVELFLRGEQVSSTQKLQTLEDWWVATTQIAEQESDMAESSGATAGSSGADLVMVLHYSRSLLFH
ncbi:unnamed protein product [Microthlaspi erraticum]|uniref:RING-type domain-containing protein n=1 Tax=Microthlaspi erraticum TaxID=1685480 RepID=A0A6D2HGR2_9BRAS|nr:unnamed protein product [Microthlaspi erraticum]